jgi:hypothetical protein
VAAVVHRITVQGIGIARAKVCGEDELSEGWPATEEAEHWRCLVELAVAATETLAGEEAAPWLADEGGAEEVPRLVRREAEHDLLHDFVHLPKLPHMLRRHRARVLVADDWGLAVP